MKIEDQVVSLLYAQKLKALGVKQESAFYWYENQSAKQFGVHKIELSLGGESDKEYYISAFTVAELGEILKDFCYPALYGFKDEFYCENYGFDRIEYETVSLNTNKEADARAKMLIYLIENKLINPS